MSVAHRVISLLRRTHATLSPSRTSASVGQALPPLGYRAEHSGNRRRAGRPAKNRWPARVPPDVSQRGPLVSIRAVPTPSRLMSREYPATSAATIAANLHPTLPGYASAMARDPRSREHYVMKSLAALPHPAFGGGAK